MFDDAFTLEERLKQVAALALGALPGEIQVLISGKPAVRVEGQALDPQIQLMLALSERLGSAPLPSLPIDAARRSRRRDALVFAGLPVPVAAVRDVEIDGAEGPLGARHYVPDAPGGPHPLLVYFHGGGFVLCDLDTHDAACRVLCHEAQAHVLSVDYRLAPEHPFPAAIEDALAALRWGQANAEALGADPTRVAVGGDSAGATLAAVASLMASRDGGPAPVMQLLIYPTTDRTSKRPSHRLFAEGFFLTDAERIWFDRHYMGETPLGDTDWRHSPLLAPDLSGLPPAVVVTAAFDPLRDDGEAYAAALEAAGNQVVSRRVPGQVHGFINMIGFSAQARSALVQIAKATRALMP